MGFKEALQQAGADSDKSSDSSSGSGSGSGYDANGIDSDPHKSDPITDGLKDRKTTTDYDGIGMSLPSGLEPDDFPYRTRATPYAVVRESSDGLEFVANAGIVGVVMEKSWYSAPWEYADAKPAEWERVWWTRDAFRRSEWIVESEINVEFRRVLKHKPRQALGVLREAARSYDGGGDSPSEHRTCVVCDDVLHVRYDSFREVNNKPVCSDHTIEEVMEAGLHVS